MTMQLHADQIDVLHFHLLSLVACAFRVSGVFSVGFSHNVHVEVLL